MRLLVAALTALAVLSPTVPVGARAVTDGAIVVSEVGGLSEETIDGVREAARLVDASWTIVHRGTLRLLGVRRGAEPVQIPPPGMGYPMVVAAIDPVAGRPLLGGELAEVLAAGSAAMGERTAALRGAAVGDTITLEGWNGAELDLVVGALVPDAELSWDEILVGSDVAESLGLERPATALLWGYPDEGVAAFAVRQLIPKTGTRISTPAAPVELEDWVLPPVMVKERFGEFAFRPSGRGDRIVIDQAWRQANIVTLEYPIIGRFPCHRAVAPYLRAALDELEALNLDWMIDRDDFQRAGGCFNPRLIRGGGDRGFALSRHAWGIAVDINPSMNPYGGPVRLDERVGDVFRRWGFAWGAGWTVPDGMHFEWQQIRLSREGCSDLGLARSAQADGLWEVYPRKGRCGTG